MKKQYIVICMCDSDNTHGLHHVQATRRRFESLRKAKAYAYGIPETRDPQVVKVRAVSVDDKGYPKPTEGKTLMEVFSGVEDHHDAEEN